jgi:hypothetical protein
LTVAALSACLLMLSLLSLRPEAAASTTEPALKSARKAAPQFPGDRPGRVYLGMSCDDCAKRERHLDQEVGLKRWFKKWGDWRGVAAAIKEDRRKHRRPWISIEGPGGGNPAGWLAVGKGEYDGDLRALARVLKANDDRPIFLSFDHEVSNNLPDDKGRSWAKGFTRFHDVLDRKGALDKVALAPIVAAWLFDPANPQDAGAWIRPGVLRRASFMGVDLYQSDSGRSFAQRLPRVDSWLAQHGHPDMKIGLGEIGATDAFGNVLGPNWLNRSLRWAARNNDVVVAVSYFNSTANSDPGVYWPLDESADKLAVYLKWLNRRSFISRVR